MKRFFSKRAVPTLVLIALSFGALIVGDLVAQCQAAGQWPKEEDPTATALLKGGGVLGGGVRSLIPGAEEQSIPHDAVSKTLQEDFEEEYALYSDSSDKIGTLLETRAQVYKLLAHSQINVKATSYLAKEARDEEGNRKWERGPEETVFVDGQYAYITISSECEGYVYVFAQDANGNIDILFPRDLRTKKGEIRKTIEDLVADDGNKIIPSDAKKCELDVPVNGMYIEARYTANAPEYVFAIVTNMPLKPEKLRKFAEAGEAEKGISIADIGFLAKALSSGAVDGKDVLIDAPEEELCDFKYGVCRLQTWVFKTKEEKEKYFANPQTYFVGIGIDRFKSKYIRNLPGCVNDVNKLLEVLVAQSAVKKEHAVLLTNEKADFEHIQFLLSVFLPSILRPCDRLILHCSSHGVMVSDSFHLVTHDAEVTELGKPEVVNHMVTSDDLNRWSYLLPGRKILYLIDCCYSGGVIDKSFSWVEQNFSKALGGVNMDIITSSADDQISLVDKDCKIRSVMSKIMTDYLDERRNVDAYDLGRAIKAKVASTARDQYGIRQSVWWGTGMKEGVFIINPKK
ncbi:MAG: caspase family protein [Thermoguttaceae bacterium]|nr:caspase family protein [Thermoguttaceae bacterium]